MEGSVRLQGWTGSQSVSLLVATSVWSLALRRDVEQSVPELVTLRHTLLGSDQVFMTGLVLQELPQERSHQSGTSPKLLARSRRAELLCLLFTKAPNSNSKDRQAEARTVISLIRRNQVLGIFPVRFIEKSEATRAVDSAERTTRPALFVGPLYFHVLTFQILLISITPFLWRLGITVLHR